jgi:hypothetical protein
MTPEDLAIARKEAADFFSQTSEAIFAQAEAGSATYIPDVANDLDIVVRLKLSVDLDAFYDEILEPKGFVLCGDYEGSKESPSGTPFAEGTSTSSSQRMVTSTRSGSPRRRFVRSSASRKRTSGSPSARSSGMGRQRRTSSGFGKSA